MAEIVRATKQYTEMRKRMEREYAEKCWRMLWENFLTEAEIADILSMVESDIDEQRAKHNDHI